MQWPDWITDTTTQWAVGVIFVPLLAFVIKKIFFTSLAKASDDSVSISDDSNENTIHSNNPTYKAKRDIYIHHNNGIPQKVVDRLEELLESKDIAIQDKDSKLREMACQFKELEERLAEQAKDNIVASKARELLQEGDIDGAQALFAHSLEQNMQLVSRQRKQAASDAFDLASIFELKLEYDEAESYFSQAVSLAPDNSHYLNSYGLLLKTKGDYGEAIRFYNMALEICINRNDYPNEASCYINLGTAWSCKGNYNKSIEYEDKGLDIFIKTLGENHPHTAECYNNLGETWRLKGDYDKAIEYSGKALAIKLKVLGHNHPSVAVSYNNLGLIWGDKGNHDKAIYFYEKSLDMSVKTLSEHDPSLAISYSNLGGAWVSKHEYKKAVELYEKALAIFLKTLGHKHPNVATAYNNLGENFRLLGQYNKSGECHEKALAIRLGLSSASHRDLAESYNSIGLLWYSKGVSDKATHYLNKALATSEAGLGNCHPITETIRKNIASIP